jgi:hypothetical protein
MIVSNSRESSMRYAIDNMKQAIIFRRKEDLWKYCIDKMESEVPVIVECGVFKGYSINYFAKLRPNGEIYGFDSFRGLREDWDGHFMTKGWFDLKGNPPKVFANVSLTRGWFHETLPTWVSNFGDSQIDFLHIDSDTYLAARVVLEKLKGNLKRGSIIVFDEYFGYPNWEEHEFAAWRDFVQETKISYRYLGFSDEAVGIIIQ